MWRRNLWLAKIIPMREYPKHSTPWPFDLVKCAQRFFIISGTIFSWEAISPSIFHQWKFCNMGFSHDFFLVILNPCCIFPSGNHCLKIRALHEKMCNDENSLNNSSITILQYGFCLWIFSNHFEPVLYFCLKGVSAWKEM